MATNEQKIAAAKAALDTAWQSNVSGRRPPAHNTGVAFATEHGRDHEGKVAPSSGLAKDAADVGAGLRYRAEQQAAAEKE